MKHYYLIILLILIIKFQVIAQDTSKTKNNTDFNFVDSGINNNQIFILNSILKLKMQITVKERVVNEESPKYSGKLNSKLPEKIKEKMRDNFYNFLVSNNLEKNYINDSIKLSYFNKNDTLIYFEEMLDDSTFTIGKYKYIVNDNFNVNSIKLVDSIFYSSYRNTEHMIVLFYADIITKSKNKRTLDKLTDVIGNPLYDSYSYQNYSHNYDFIKLYVFMIEPLTHHILYYFNSNNVDDENTYLFKRRADRNRTWKKIMNIAFTDFMQVYNKKTNQQPTH